MRGRRTTSCLLAAVLFAAGLAGCSATSERPTSDRTPVDRPGVAGSTGADGTASPAASPGVAGAPATRAGKAPDRRFDVDFRELTFNRGDRRLPVTVWYPSAPGGGVARGPFPVVLFSHGLGGSPTDYRPLLTRWAAAGFVAAAPSYPHTSRGAPDPQILDVINQPADASHVLTRLLALNSQQGDPFRGRLDPERIGAAGHSAGGITTIGLFTTGRDERFDAGIVLAGSALGVGTAFSGQAAPQLFVHGELDEVVSYRAGRAAYDQVPWPKAMLSLPAGDHGRSLLSGGEPALGVVAGTTVEFLRWSLYGDPAAKRRLPDAAVEGGLATLDDNL